jgi:hypothetical protein
MRWVLGLVVVLMIGSVASAVVPVAGPEIPFSLQMPAGTLSATLPYSEDLSAYYLYGLELAVRLRVLSACLFEVR